MQKIKIIALFGKSASGKDTIQNLLVQQYKCHGIVSTTTRPMREGEEEGKSYYFIDEEEFANRVMNMSMLEAASFRDWFYGTEIKALDAEKINVGVFNIEGIKNLMEDDRLFVYPILINSTNKTRLIRSLNREQDPDCHEICRRFLTDELDFREENLDFVYDVVDNVCCPMNQGSNVAAAQIATLFNL